MDYRILGPTFTIAEMPPWYLWIAPNSLGITDQEQSAFEDVSVERKLELSLRIQFAFDSLVNAPVGGSEWWMETRRAAN